MRKYGFPFDITSKFILLPDEPWFRFSLFHVVHICTTICHVNVFNEMYWTLYYSIPWMPFSKFHVYISVVLLILLSMRANLLFSYPFIVYNVYNGIGLAHKFADRVIRFPWSLLSIWQCFSLCHWEPSQMHSYDGEC